MTERVFFPYHKNKVYYIIIGFSLKFIYTFRTVVKQKSILIFCWQTDKIYLEHISPFR
jgi:hypothetical protein